MTSPKNDFYEKLFEVVFFRDFFKILASKNIYNKMMKYLELHFKISSSNELWQKDITLKIYFKKTYKKRVQKNWMLS